MPQRKDENENRYSLLLMDWYSALTNHKDGILGLRDSFPSINSTGDSEKEKARAHLDLMMNKAASRIQMATSPMGESSFNELKVKLEKALTNFLKEVEKETTPTDIRIVKIQKIIEAINKEEFTNSWKFAKPLVKQDKVIGTHRSVITRITSALNTMIKKTSNANNNNNQKLPEQQRPLASESKEELKQSTAADKQASRVTRLIGQFEKLANKFKKENSTTQETNEKFDQPPPRPGFKR